MDSMILEYPSMSIGIILIFIFAFLDNNFLSNRIKSKDGLNMIF